MNTNLKMVKGALLLALLLIAQSLRLILPIPPFIIIFIIGTFINAIIFTATKTTSLKITLIISIIAPIVAYIQGQLPLIPFIPLVALGNITFAIAVYITQNKNIMISALIAAICKTTLLISGLHFIIQAIKLPQPIITAMSFALGWPQIITATAGALLGNILIKRLNTNQLDKHP